MSHPQPEAPPAETPRDVRLGVGASPRTGVGTVDDVLDEVSASASLPLEAQLPVLERAHERLRAALDDTA